MTNEFKILWFEDETTWYTMQSKKVANHLKNTYNLKTTPRRETGSNFDPNILKTENTYDLILMDYKLAAGNTGEKIIELIRNNSILTDVLLYSSQYQDMVDALVTQSPLIDGVYFADRKNALFEDKLYGVIHKIVRRSEDIVNLRGFFLDNTSDFEVRIKELLKLGWDKLSDHHSELEATMNTVLDNILAFDDKTVKEIKESDSIYNAANNHKYALSIRSRLEILKKVIDLLVEKDKIDLSGKYADIKEFDKKYNNDISVYRNAMGHKKYSDTSLEIKGRIVQIDEDFHRKLRDNINRYDGFICYLEDCISSI